LQGINVAPLNVKVIGIETHEEEGWSAPWAIIGALMASRCYNLSCWVYLENKEAFSLTLPFFAKKK
jgi:hypothetical protein